MDALPVITWVKRGEYLKGLIQVPDGVSVKACAQDGMEALDVPILLGRIRVGEDQVQVIVLELALHHGSDELWSVVAAHLHMQLLVQQISGLQVVLDHLIPCLGDLMLGHTQARLPVQGLAREGVQDSKDVAVTPLAGDPFALDVHLQYIPTTLSSAPFAASTFFTSCTLIRNVPAFSYTLNLRGCACTARSTALKVSLPKNGCF